MEIAAAKILVVDDELVLRTVLREVLERVGYEIYTASDGWEALEIFAAQQPVLTIVDLRMPGMDGSELLEKVKERHPRISRMLHEVQLKSIGVSHEQLAGYLLRLWYFSKTIIDAIIFHHHPLP